MPGWHAKTKALQESGKLQVVGLIQEQHPQRCRLFMQWKQMEWPVMTDPLNLLGVRAVPITLAIDRHGIIRQVNPSLEELKKDFLNHDFPKPESDENPKPAHKPDLSRLAQQAKQDPSPRAWRAWAQALVLWGPPSDLTRAIQAYQNALKHQPDHGPTHFQIGVAYRRRYESDLREPNDFQAAIRHWSQAPEINPNQYIWRRRLQQYGPQLDKPYPFYDWVSRAQKAVRDRGQEPVTLVTDLTRSERAHPTDAIEAAFQSKGEPDPQDRIYRDKRGFIQIESTLVPQEIGPGESIQVHLLFRPNASLKAHWNNQVGNLKVWLDPPDGWHIEKQLWEIANPPKPISHETRRLELELKAPESLKAKTVSIPGYALYYVCEDVDGTCLYRRQDLSLEVQVTSEM